MNIIILLSILISSNIYAQLNCSPREKVNVVYINGIATGESGYLANRKRLDDVIKPVKVRELLLLKSQEYEIDNKLYNPSEGHFNDLVESANQVLIESQEGEYSKSDVYKLLARLKFGSAAAFAGIDPATRQLIENLFHDWRKGLNSLPLQQKTVDDIYEAIKPRIDNNERVFIVSHSQGNLFANEVLKRLYDEVEDGSPERFLLDANVANMRLAPPSSITHGSSSYMKFDVDWVVSDLTGADYNYVVKRGGRDLRKFLLGAVLAIKGIGGINLIVDGATVNGDPTGHGMKEVYLGSNVYVSKIGTNEGYKSAENVFVNDMQMLAEGMGDTCDPRIKLKDEEGSGKLEDYIQIDNYSADMFKISLKPGAPLYSDFKEFIELDTSTEELKTTINISSGFVSEISNDPPYILVLKPLANSSIYPYKLNISIDFQYKYLEEFDYTGVFSDEFEICTGRDCCSTAGNVEFDETNRVCKVKDGVMVSHSCTKGTLEGKDVCIAKTVCKYQSDHLAQYGNAIPGLPSLFNPEINENNWTYTSYKANDRFSLYNGEMKSNVTSHCGYLTNYEDPEAAQASCECAL